MISGHPRLTPARPDLAAQSLRGVVEAPRYVEPRPMRVVAPVASLRREPRPDAALDTQLLMGEPFAVFDEDKEGFAWGQSGWDAYVGYVSREALGPAEPAPTHRVAALSTPVYPGPSLKLPTETFLPINAEVAVAGEEKGYARLAGGGFVHAAHLAPLGTSEPDFVAVAERFLHTPYLWGGRTGLGLDCSSLVQMAMRAAGIAAPRDSDMQEAFIGEKLVAEEALSQLRRGDLVFWKGHVAIMLDDTRMIHANGHHMAVAIEPFEDARARILASSYGAVTSVRRP
ncbi:MAG: NlpC/P60 family protein [Salinarimonadaceae bacterium]|nr:MAG: NlpC/P60 family protein [Salinarimonadaceae bacterium]